MTPEQARKILPTLASALTDAGVLALVEAAKVIVAEHGLRPKERKPRDPLTPTVTAEQWLESMGESP